MASCRMHPLAVSVLCAVVLASSACPQQNQWDLKIELAKNHYVLHEPIWLDITLTNITTDTLRTYGLTAPNHRQFYIELKDSLGNMVKYTGPRYLIASHPGELMLAPRQQDYGSFDVVRLFGVFDEDAGRSEMSLRFPFIPSGSYTILARFESATSNEQTLTVEEPSGDASDALQLIRQASDVWRQGNPEPSAQILREVIERYPNSPFREKCFYLTQLYSAENWHRWRQGTAYKRLLERTMLEQYPNSGQARDWIAAITHEMDEQAKRQFLTDLAAAHPNTRAAKYIRILQDRQNKPANID